MSISSLQSLLLFNSYYMNSVRKIQSSVGGVGQAAITPDNKLLDDHLSVNEKIGFAEVRI